MSTPAAELDSSRLGHHLWFLGQGRQTMLSAHSYLDHTAAIEQCECEVAQQFRSLDERYRSAMFRLKTLVGQSQ